MEYNAPDLQTPEMSEAELDNVSGGLKMARNNQKSYDNENKLGNFEIQGLMTDMNQQPTLVSVSKKKGGTTTGLNG